MKTIDEYSKFLRVDRNALDEALMQQPELFHRISDEVALAVSRRDGAKDELKRIRAELFIEVKREHADEKPTETLVSSMVETHEDYLEAQKEYLEASLEADRWTALKEAFLQRSYVLKDLASLFISGYYSDSSTRGATRETDEVFTQQRRAAISGEREKRKRLRV